MHALGTNITKGNMKPVPYATNRSVPPEMLCDMIVSLHAIGKACFPDVLGVILGLEADSGLEPIPPMNGDGVERVGFTIDMSVNLGMLHTTMSTTLPRVMQFGQKTNHQ
ncbi:hypothetical protein MHU86_14703 [Fragilaria crotonensis]|nr:hypothetical protein MHU86_14703 [Fragilaria crotonensis]